MTVVGVDACKAGWIAVIWRNSEVSAVFLSHISDLAKAVPDVEQVAIDMPINLAHHGLRTPDIAAKRLLGRRSSTIFMVPPRRVVEAPNYEEAQRRSREIIGRGVSRQSFGLSAKILEVDHWLEQAPCPVVESHPEVSFATLLGSPIWSSKKTWSGMSIRRQALMNIGIVLDDVPSDVGQLSSVDDMLDAGILAWTAQRVKDGEAISLPAQPQLNEQGLPMAIYA